VSDCGHIWDNRRKEVGRQENFDLSAQLEDKLDSRQNRKLSHSSHWNPAHNPLLPDAELALGLVGEWTGLEGGGQGLGKVLQ
jgi:hypothetical protein